MAQPHTKVSGGGSTITIADFAIDHVAIEKELVRLGKEEENDSSSIQVQDNRDNPITYTQRVPGRPTGPVREEDKTSI